MHAQSYRALLRQADIAELLLAAGLARLAGRMFLLAIVLYALDRFGSPLLAGWIGFAAMAPGLLVSPVAGALLDRLGGPGAIVLDMACSAALLLGLVALRLADADSAPVVLALAGLYALTNPLSAAGIRVMLPRLVPPNALQRTNALDTAIHAVVEVIGPALAGAIFAVAGGGAAMLAIALLYAAAGLVLRPALRRAPPAIAPRHRALLVEALAGIGYLFRHRSLRALALAYALYNAAWGALLVAVPVAVAALLPGSAEDLAVGGLWAVSGLAAGLGALVAGRFGGPGREHRVMALGMLASGVAVYPLCASFGLAGLAAGLAAFGFLAGPVDVAVLTLRQRRTDPAWLGRVMAVSMSLNLSGAPIGSALGGVLATRSAALAFAAAALACALAALAAWLLLPARPESPPMTQ
jgi:MFS family permease